MVGTFLLLVISWYYSNISVTPPSGSESKTGGRGSAQSRGSLFPSDTPYIKEFLSIKCSRSVMVGRTPTSEHGERVLLRSLRSTTSTLLPPRVGFFVIFGHRPPHTLPRHGVCGRQ